MEDGALVGEVFTGLADALLAWKKKRGSAVETRSARAGCAVSLSSLLPLLPVHSARKFSTVLGTVLPYRPMTMRPEMEGRLVARKSENEREGAHWKGGPIDPRALCFRAAPRLLAPSNSPAGLPPMLTSKKTCVA